MTRYRAGSDAFSKWMQDLPEATIAVLLCTDVALAERRNALHAELTTTATRLEASRERGGGEMLAETTPGPRVDLEAEVKRIQGELAKVDKDIANVGTEIEVTCPSEDQMLSIDDIRPGGDRENIDEWYRRMVGFAFGSQEQADEFRSRFPRATWAHLCIQIANRAVSLDMTIPFSSGDSEKTRR